MPGTVSPESMDPSGCSKTQPLPRPPQVKIRSTAVKTSATATIKIPQQNRQGNTLEK